MKSKYMFAAFLLALVGAASGAVAASAQHELSANEKRNEEVVRAFYDAAINGKDFDAAARHLGERYVQHNPTAGDGHEGLKKFISFLKANLPNYKSRIVAVFTDGDYVILHVHNVREPNSRGFAIVDIFRLEEGKIVEHWDVRQEVPDPAAAANKNGMF